MSGIFGVLSKKENAQMITYYALYSIQHRGEYGCGIASDHNGYIDYKKGYGLVTSVIDRKDLKLLRGKSSLGHVSNSQVEIPKQELDPKVMGYKDGAMAICFDGFLTNYDELKKKIDMAGVDYENVSHTEIIGNLIALNYKGDLVESIKETLKMVKGAFAFLLMTDDFMVAARDSYGIKQLVMGTTDEGDILFSSETCSFDAVGADFDRDLRPGEFILVKEDTIESEDLLQKKSNKACIFEVIYTSRPDSILHGGSIYSKRLNAGRIMGENNDVEEVDVVIAAPDSGTVYAVGYAETSKKPYGIGIIKNRYIGRTFIEKGTETRIDKVRIKLNALREVINGKNVLVVDDSIVRGTTMLRTVKMLRDAGAKSVHVRVASPMVYYDCKIGVNQSVTGNMLAREHSKEEIRQIIGADSLEYIEFEDMIKAFGNKDEYCTGCINDVYPFELEE